MSKHEIEIEGLPEGYVPVSCKIDYEESDETGFKFVMGKISVRRKVRKYDWSKTLSDVLVKNGNGYLMRHGDCSHPTRWLSDLWQPNIHGKCPVDPEASIVRVKYADGRCGSEVKASTICWSYGYGAATVIAYQVVGLVEYVEW